MLSHRKWILLWKLEMCRFNFYRRISYHDVFLSWFKTEYMCITHTYNVNKRIVCKLGFNLYEHFLKVKTQFNLKARKKYIFAISQVHQNRTIATTERKKKGWFKNQGKFKVLQSLLIPDISFHQEVVFDPSYRDIFFYLFYT